MPIDIDRLSEAELIDLNHRIVARLQFLQQLEAHSSMLEFRIGELVRFHPTGRPAVVGVIIRYNKKTVSILTAEGGRWNVAPQLLERVDQPSEQSPKHGEVIRRPGYDCQLLSDAVRNFDDYAMNAVSHGRTFRAFFGEVFLRRRIFLPRVDLQVPFHDKEEAKRRGARWDGLTWYIPDGINPKGFEAWAHPPMPTVTAPNIRAPGWSLTSGTRKCWRCGQSSEVFAILVPAGHEALNFEDEGPEPVDDEEEPLVEAVWIRRECRALLSYVRAVPESVAVTLRRIAPRYRVDHSKTTHSDYLMNHCRHCDAKLGDYETLEEPGSLYDLGPGIEGATLRVSPLRDFAEPFMALCSGQITVDND